MSKFDNSLVDKIASSCIKLYSELPKTGKPIEAEWTVLSCVVQFDSISRKFEVVALGTGSKCIGASKMSALGDVLNDSHAEVFARRGFLLYLYDNIDYALESKQSIFIFENGSFKLKENIEFIFYSSQLPCGDASILPKSGEEELYGEILQTLKKQVNEDICDVECKRARVDDVHRTGAKCLPGSEQDSKLQGPSYHILGQVRTKPGRGDRTQSVSCSDKMARWIHVGIQGGLLDLLLSKPIFITHFIFGAGVPYSDESLKRALLTRDVANTTVIRTEIVPGFHQSSVMFPDVRTEKKIRPAPGSIVWTQLKMEVAVQGRKLGVTKKKSKFLSSSLCISKYNIYKRFQNIMNENEDIKNQIGIDSNHNLPYNKMKQKSVRYLNKWKYVKDEFFRSWTKKPDMWNFCIIDS